MVKSKIVTVRDTGTRMEFLISKFEEKDKEKLSKTGYIVWLYRGVSCILGVRYDTNSTKI